MLTRQKVNQILAAILETAAEVQGGAPSGVMYAALSGQLSLADFNEILAIATDCHLVKVESHLVMIQPKGLQMVSKIQAFKESRS